MLPHPCPLLYSHCRVNKQNWGQFFQVAHFCQALDQNHNAIIHTMSISFAETSKVSTHLVPFATHTFARVKFFFHHVTSTMLWWCRDIRKDIRHNSDVLQLRMQHSRFSDSRRHIRDTRLHCHMQAVFRLHNFHSR